jgi:uncharacterized protein YpiB (UPF0302 family)
MNKTKLTLLLLTALLAGVCLGFFTNSAIIRARIRKFSQIPANLPEHITNRLTERLKLDDTQRAEVLAVFKAHETRMQETRAQSQALIDAMIEEVRVEISRHLTPVQQEEHKKLLAEMRLRQHNHRALLRAFPPPPPKENGASNGNE